MDLPESTGKLPGSLVNAKPASRDSSLDDLVGELLEAVTRCHCCSPGRFDEWYCIDGLRQRGHEDKLQSCSTCKNLPLVRVSQYTPVVKLPIGSMYQNAVCGWLPLWVQAEASTGQVDEPAIF